MSATVTVDPKKYARLANRIVIKAIETEEEYDHMAAAVEQLMDKGEDRLSTEESALLETMGDLLPALGTRGRVSEVLSGKRSISKEQAKKLASMFKVTTDLFI
jgi:HTH-type transcriptional regulator / antitoxin HigA